MIISFVIITPLTAALGRALNLHIFQSDTRNDDIVCTGDTVIFDDIYSPDTVNNRCLLKCSQLITCVSAFIIKDTGQCVGCISEYAGLNSDNISLLTGSVYYVKRSSKFDIYTFTGFDMYIVHCSVLVTDPNRIPFYFACYLQF